VIKNYDVRYDIKIIWYHIWYHVAHGSRCKFTMFKLCSWGFDASELQGEVLRNCQLSASELVDIHVLSDNFETASLRSDHDSLASSHLYLILMTRISQPENLPRLERWRGGVFSVPVYNLLAWECQSQMWTFHFALHATSSSSSGFWYGLRRQWVNRDPERLMTISKPRGYYIILYCFGCIIRIKTLLKHIMTLLFHLFHLQFWTIMSYYFICQKSAIISIISLLLYPLFLFNLIMSIIAIKQYYST
jgi:hypothetical protein